MYGLKGRLTTLGDLLETLMLYEDQGLTTTEISQFTKCIAKVAPKFEETYQNDDDDDDDDDDYDDEPQVLQKKNYTLFYFFLFLYF